MVDNKQQKVKWGELVERAYLRWPDENVIRFMNRTFINCDKSDIKVLDFGCGAGRNTVALVDEGFQVYGVDYSDLCVEITKKRCQEITKSSVVVKQNQGTDIPIEAEFLDAVIACGSLFYSNFKERKLLMKNINRILKNEGVFWANWRSVEDSMYGQGHEIEKNLYLLDSGERKNLVYYFTTLKDLKELYNYAGFEIYNIEKLEMSVENLKKKNSWWHICARKKKVYK